jgi:hypothetical protein
MYFEHCINNFRKLLFILSSMYYIFCLIFVINNSFIKGSGDRSSSYGNVTFIFNRFYLKQNKLQLLG